MDTPQEPVDKSTETKYTPPTFGGAESGKPLQKDIKGYRMVSMPTVEEMETEVNKGIEQGYVPLGAPLCHPPQERDPQRPWRFTQAMVHRDL